MNRATRTLKACTVILFLSPWLAADGDAADSLDPEIQSFSMTAIQPIVLSSYAQIRYRSLEDKPDGFDVRRARVSLKGKLSKQFGYRLQAELAGASQKILDVELSYTVHPMFRLSAGQFKIPFSRENLASSARLETINRSQAVEALTGRGADVIGNQNGRDIGIRLEGNFRMAELAVGLFNGSGINQGDRDDSKDVAGRLVFKPISGIAIGGSFYSGQYTPADAAGRTARRDRIGAEMTCTVFALSIQAEYIQGKDGPLIRSGWYAQAGYFFIPRRVQGVIKYDVFDPDEDDSKGERSVFTLGVNYQFDAGSRIQMNFERHGEESHPDYHAFIVQLQCGF